MYFIYFHFPFNLRHTKTSGNNAIICENELKPELEPCYKKDSSRVGATLIKTKGSRVGEHVHEKKSSGAGVVSFFMTAPCPGAGCRSRRLLLLLKIKSHSDSGSGPKKNEESFRSRLRHSGSVATFGALMTRCSAKFFAKELHLLFFNCTVTCLSFGLHLTK